MVTKSPALAKDLPSPGDKISIWVEAGADILMECEKYLTEGRRCLRRCMVESIGGCGGSQSGRRIIQDLLYIIW